MIIKKRLFTPGPTPVLPEAAVGMTAPILHHRKPEFKTLLKESHRMLQSIFKTDGDVLIVASSGTGAMESAVTNLLSSGDKALVIVGGKFGERWEEICHAFGIKTDAIYLEWGDAVDPQEIKRRLEKDDAIRAVFIQACESSTGVANDIAEVGRVVAKHPRACLVVDAITGLGTMELRTDEWHLDVVIGGSQKAFMLPPGLAFISLSSKAWELVKQARLPRYYFDLARERKAQAEGQTSFTPAISLIQGLHPALQFITRMGIDNLVKNSARQAAITRAAVKALGLKLVASAPADAMTAVYTPPGIEADKLVSELNTRFGIILSGGQGKLKGRIVRIAHLGYYDFYDTIALVSCLEVGLQQLGYNCDPGAGAKAAMQVYRTFAIDEEK